MGAVNSLILQKTLPGKGPRQYLELIMPMFSLTPVPRQTLPSILLYWSLET